MWQTKKQITPGREKVDILSLSLETGSGSQVGRFPGSFP